MPAILLFSRHTFLLRYKGIWPFLQVITRIPDLPTTFTYNSLAAVEKIKFVNIFDRQTRVIMKKVVTLHTIDDYNKRVNHKTLHPLVSLVDLAKADVRRNVEVAAIEFGFYGVFLKQGKNCVVHYGRNTYDYQDGTLLFIAPGQVVKHEGYKEEYQPSGMALLFHPDLLRATSLGQHMKEYSFFSYEVHEALHLSQQERKIVMNCFSKIKIELQRSIDKHSKRLIASNIELLLNYCLRFYDRQFITRDLMHKGMVEKFDSLLDDYFQSGKPQTTGLPSVAWCAAQLHLSPKYFGDIIKKDTGKSALEYIQLKLIDRAKELLYDGTKPVSEVAYEMGFKYPQHFTRLFRNKLGFSPNQYRSSLN